MIIKLEIIKKNRTGILRLLLCIVLVAGVYIFDYHCPFLTYLHIPCLGCGMSRAWKSAIQGQWKEAFEFHKAFWSIPILCYFIFRGKLLKKKLWNVIIFGVISLSFIINYIGQFI